MTFQEIAYITGTHERDARIGTKSILDGGAEHPLWTILNIKFPPTKQWRELRGAERTQIQRAGEVLHENDIPYSFYANHLQRFGKGFLKQRSPLIITKYKPASTGMPSILGEYIKVVKFLIESYHENKDCLKINDMVYKRFPKTFEHGALHYYYGVKIIREALRNHTTNDILRILAQSDNADEFLKSLGGSVADHKPLEIDLNKGVSQEGSVKVLQREMRIRLGKDSGKSSPALNKYFKKDGTLNGRGIKVVSGESTL